MKFNKVSFAILIASGALMGCEIGGGDNSPATTMPVENISEVVGSLHTGSAYNYNPENYSYDSGNHALKNSNPSAYNNVKGKDIGRNLTFTVGSDGNVHASMRVADVKYERVPNYQHTHLYGTVCVGTGDCYYNVRGEWVGNDYTYYGYHETAKELTSTSVDKLENGAIKVVFNDENTNEAYKLLL